MRIPFAQIDAFADRPFTGNPAAVMPLDTWLPDDVLQAIAAENNLAETAFLVPGDDAWELRWFTPAVEVALCGHATLASGHYLLTERGGDAVRFATRRAGTLEVRRDGSAYALDLPLWDATATDLPDIARHVGGAPVETRWRDGGYALIVYRTADEVRALTPDFAALGAMPGNVLFIATAPGDVADVVSRVFAPGAGIDEDPATGSAHCLLTAYWCDRLGRDSFDAFQASARGARIGCRRAGDRAVLSGGCVTVIEGSFLLT